MRVIDLCVSRERVDGLRQRVEELEHRVFCLADGDPAVLRVVMRGGDPDDLLEDLRESLREEVDGEEHYVVFEPLAIEPRPEEERDEEDHEEFVAGTDEIESFVDEGAYLTRSFIVLSVLSGVLASAALLRDSPAVLVGSMVVAPLFRPLALAGVSVLLGQASRALRAFLWLGVSLALAAAAGLLVTLATPDRSVTGLIESRTGTSPFDLVVALAAGLAMAYTIVKKDSLAMVGIVVAASLMPVAAALGVTAAVGRIDLVGGAVFTLSSNVCGIVLGLIVGLRVEELRANWRNSRKARMLTRRSLLGGSALALGLLGVGIWSFAAGSGTSRERSDLMAEAAKRDDVAGAMQLHGGVPVLFVHPDQLEQVRSWITSEHQDLEVLYVTTAGGLTP